MRTPLTTPIGLGQQALEYELVTAHLDLVAGRIEMGVAYFDATGARIFTRQVVASFGELPFNPNALTVKITSHLTSEGEIN